MDYQYQSSGQVGRYVIHVYIGLSLYPTWDLGGDVGCALCVGCGTVCHGATLGHHGATVGYGAIVGHGATEGHSLVISQTFYEGSVS